MDPQQTRMAAVYLLPLYRDTLLGRVTHLCPRMLVANGLGPDWSEVRDVGRAGLRRVQEMQTYGEPGRHGQRARSVPLEGDGTLIQAT